MAGKSNFIIGALKKKVSRLERERDSLLPRVGTIWVWEPLKAHAQEVVRVTEIRYEDELLVETESLATGERHWNDVARFMEASVFWMSGDDE